MTERIKIPDEIVAALRQPLPKEAIKPHPSKPYLSTIKTIYSIERLNEVFGMNGWEDHYEVVESTGPMIVVKGELLIPEYGIRREAFGGHDNTDRGDAYKGACTDALSKMVSALYIGMDVYKGQPNAPATPPKAQPSTSATPTPATAPSTPSTAGDFWYENGVMDCEVMDVRHFPAKNGRKETCVLSVNSPEPLPNKLTCWHLSLIPALATAKKGDRAVLVVKKALKDGKTYLNIEDVRTIGAQTFHEGLPVEVRPVEITDDDIPF
jgi:hypothetical protein